MSRRSLFSRTQDLVRLTNNSQYAAFTETLTLYRYQVKQNGTTNGPGAVDITNCGKVLLL